MQLDGDNNNNNNNNNNNDNRKNRAEGLHRSRNVTTF